ncbi:MAG: LytTR family transcriptional regulator [Reichenbachiella sp.]
MNKNLIGILLRIFTALVIGHFITVLGSTDWFFDFAHDSYFLEMTLSASTAWVLLEYTHHVIQYLDKNFGWQNSIVTRLIWQTILAGIIPLCMAAFSTYLQSTYVYENGVWGNGYFEVEFPTSFLFVVIVNLFYVILNLAKSSNPLLEKSPTDSIVIGKRRNTNVPIKADNIAHLILKNEVIYLTTFDNEEVILTENLDHYQKILIDNTFFRVNRQSIINRDACKSYSAVENGKIEVVLNSNQTDPVIVSQKRAAQFRSWIKG